MSGVRKVLSFRFLRKKKSGILTTEQERGEDHEEGKDRPPVPPQLRIIPPPSSPRIQSIIDLSRTTSLESAPQPQAHSSNLRPHLRVPSILKFRSNNKCSVCQISFQRNELRTCGQCKRNKFCSHHCQQRDNVTTCTASCRQSAWLEYVFEPRYRINLDQVLKEWITANYQNILPAFKRGLLESPSDNTTDPHIIFINLKGVTLEIGSDGIPLPILKTFRVHWVSVEPIKEVTARWKSRQNEDDTRLRSKLIHDIIINLEEQERRCIAAVVANSDNNTCETGNMIVAVMVEDKGVVVVLREVYEIDEVVEEALISRGSSGRDWRKAFVDSLYISSQ